MSLTVFTINKINNNSVLTYNYVVFSFPPKVYHLGFTLLYQYQEQGSQGFI